MVLLFTTVPLITKMCVDQFWFQEFLVLLIIWWLFYICRAGWKFIFLHFFMACDIHHLVAILPNQISWKRYFFHFVIKFPFDLIAKIASPIDGYFEIGENTNKFPCKMYKAIVNLTYLLCVLSSPRLFHYIIWLIFAMYISREHLVHLHHL